MKNRASATNLLLSLAAYAVFMLIVLSAVGFRVGVLELIVWTTLVAVGSGLIVRRHVRARSDAEVAPVHP
ncbi:hypothetical protein [Nocardioides sp.]|uniref:hypothetical protein n=1 Tax=Nocardioides sp. TaxID=35761 RepID=UPI0026358600|nr:hypothetical protein [Nocardioides sp.]